jgi:hypothetical protein
MINIEDLKIGDKIIKNNPRNTWRIHTNVMHGDADKYETRILDLPDEVNREWTPSAKDLPIYIAILDAHLKVKYNDRREHEEVHKIIKSLIKNQEDVDYWLDRYSILVPGDCISDYQYKSSIQKFWITRFGIHGDEYEVILPKNIMTEGKY